MFLSNSYMDKYEKKAREMMSPAPATKKIWRPSDYIGYSKNFEEVPVDTTQVAPMETLKSMSAVNTDRKSVGGVSNEGGPDTYEDAVRYYKTPQAQALIKALGLETSESGLPVIQGFDMDYVEEDRSTGDVYRDKLLADLMFK
jgi:hypothetical protein